VYEVRKHPDPGAGRRRVHEEPGRPRRSRPRRAELAELVDWLARGRKGSGP
jgi:hypothetical protein